jgi:hypothetical protein
MKRPSVFAIGAFDYFAAFSFGVVAALAAWLVVPDPFPMPVAMLAGMGIGVLAALPLFGLFSFLLGGFEIIVMSMQIAMLSGMIGAMLGSGPMGDAVLVGGAAGLGVQFILDVANRMLHGEVHLHD